MLLSDGGVWLFLYLLKFSIIWSIFILQLKKIKFKNKACTLVVWARLTSSLWPLNCRIYKKYEDTFWKLRKIIIITENLLNFPVVGVVSVLGFEVIVTLTFLRTHNCQVCVWGPWKVMYHLVEEFKIQNRQLFKSRYEKSWNRGIKRSQQRRAKLTQKL